MKTFFCQNHCGTEIYFSDNHISKTGKKIPLDIKTQQPHQCPNSKYNKELPPQNTENPQKTENAAGKKFQFEILPLVSQEYFQMLARETYEIYQVVNMELQEEVNPAVKGMIFKEVLERAKKEKQK